ncbi:MAPEG family protein [Aquisalinus flavus]|uniref:MAPEG family protein n=1 Tax=Aquisalinus flavus TaxID=1526572 RepID=A0A8J2V2B8_9PROT|nr:MAPEG family protein [Aquisalinus flavus]MBD0427265.1 MAPEG family protein [Aquisalinus flavus]UNE47079.1 MAPEG family protein [Aquisalinus flavus]GGC99618.1 hypothetical protein GCM10011342_05790 [Aquisalinus flavus]
MMSLVLPLLVQVALTFFLLFWVAISRSRAAGADKEMIQRSATDPSIWPDRPRQVANCYSNQFELPLLFYLVILLYIVTGGSSVLMTVLAWVFVAFRIVHMIIHTGTNRVMHRFYAFLGSMVAAIAMWALFIFHYF